MTTAVILGSGFSRCAGLPAQTELSSALLGEEFEDPLNHAITKALRRYLRNVFNWRFSDPLPTLEDIFTLIDLSTGTGHNLGRSFTPKRLRALRRMLIYRVFSILDLRFNHSTEIESFLELVLSEDSRRSTDFVVLNWDIVLERHLEFRNTPMSIDYGVNGEPWAGRQPDFDWRVKIAKVHGSSNWVYCDNCRTVFYDKSNKLALTLRAGLTKADLRLFDSGFVDKVFDTVIGLSSSERGCRICGSAVGPHIATFSYRKSFRTHGFSQSWLAADQILTASNKWVFVGYSLPDADYEFKHLLKTAELKFAARAKPPKEITAVLLDDFSAESK